MDDEEFRAALQYRIAYGLAAGEAARRLYSDASHGGGRRAPAADVERVVALVLARHPTIPPEIARGGRGRAGGAPAAVVADRRDAFSTPDPSLFQA